jgi:HK97 gp10 family phage protein
VNVTITGAPALLAKLNDMSETLRGKTLERAVVAGALLVQNEAKRRAPYLTGNLRRSIHIGGHEDLNPDKGDIVDRSGSEVPSPVIGPNTVAVYVGTDVNYAAEVEYGFGKRRPRPYLRPALDEQENAVRKEINEALGDLIRAIVR